MVFDDGKEASKCFLSEFHVIKPKVWFLYFGPRPLPGGQHNVICSVQVEEAHIVPITIASLLLAHTHLEKRPLCLSFTKAILNVVQWRTRGLCTVSQKGKEILWAGKGGLPLFCLGKTCILCSGGEWEQWAQCPPNQTSFILPSKGCDEHTDQELRNWGMDSWHFS